MSIKRKIILIRTMFSFLLLLVVSHQVCLMSFPAAGTEQLKGSEPATGASMRFSLAFSRARRSGICLDFSTENHRATNRTVI